MAVDNQLMYWIHPGLGEFQVTDHNRSALQVSIEPIEKKTRMANGRLRKYVVGKKRSWTCSWEMLPTHKDDVTVGTKSYFGTVDGGIGADGIETFYFVVNTSFILELRTGDGSVSSYTVMFSDFSKDIVKRGPGGDLCNVSITLEEV